jgi:DNA primase small subunit
MREMSDRTRSFVQDQFREYYSDCFREVGIKSGFEQREFAALSMKNRMMVRHKSFRTRNELQDFLCSMIPSDMYYSSAYYEQPDSPDMGSKGWIGADLVFDIDADHIPTSCNKMHDKWTCVNCGFNGRGEQPQRCPSCTGEKFEEDTWPCEECLISAKGETKKLLDILSKDFGFSEKDIDIFFSGHRGYHIHVEDETVKHLDSMARKEIADYVTSLGLDTDLYALEKNESGNANLKNIGWRNRIIQGISGIILNGKIGDLQKIGVKRNTAEIIVKNKETTLKHLNAAKPHGLPKGLGTETYRKLVEHSKKSQSAKIDTVVTTDVHRLIRLPGTLHGKTGFKKARIPIESLEDFDPFKKAIAFKEGTIKTVVSDAPKFRLNNEEFGPFRNEKVELPIAAALLLICKNRAELAT